MASIYIWRMEYSDERPEAFSDRDSVKERDKRTISAISFSLSMFLLAAVIFAALIFFASNISTNDRTQLIIAAVVFIILAIILGAIIIYINKRSRQ